jgi:hypothetical protein
MPSRLLDGSTVVLVSPKKLLSGRLMSVNEIIKAIFGPAERGMFSEEAVQIP